jgi:Leucine-rich repeat (LRR) protein
MSQLQTLGLENTNLTDDMLASLVGLQNLEILWLSKTAVTDAAFGHFEKMSSLRTVYLHGSQVTKEGAEQFRSTHSGFNLHY